MLRFFMELSGNQLQQIAPCISLPAMNAKTLRMQHKAVAKYRTTIVLALLQAGADPNVQDIWQRTPLLEALQVRSELHCRCIAV